MAKSLFFQGNNGAKIRDWLQYVTGKNIFRTEIGVLKASQKMIKCRLGR